MFQSDPEIRNYPVRLDVRAPDQLSRRLPFVKWLLATPHYFALGVLAIGAAVAAGR